MNRRAFLRTAAETVAGGAAALALGAEAHAKDGDLQTIALGESGDFDEGLSRLTKVFAEKLEAFFEKHVDKNASIDKLPIKVDELVEQYLNAVAVLRGIHASKRYPALDARALGKATWMLFSRAKNMKAAMYLQQEWDIEAKKAEQAVRTGGLPQQENISIPTPRSVSDA